MTRRQVPTEKLATDHGEAILLPPVSHEPPAVHAEVGTRLGDRASTERQRAECEPWDHDKYPLPTDEDRATLRKVPDTIPAIAYVLCVAELAERASYYATMGVFSNFLEYPLPAGGNGAGAPDPRDPNGVAGALGKGVQVASAVTLLFTFLAYVVPVGGAWLADTRLGRYNTILLGAGIGAVAHVLMTAGAAPALLQRGQGAAPFLVALLLLAVGAGVFKPNVAPTVMDQYTRQRQFVRTLPRTGERVLVDPETTLQRIMVVYYGFINVGAFFALASTYAEKYVGFWLAFLLPTAVYTVVVVVFVGARSRMVRKPPVGSELNDFFAITWLCCKKNGFRVWRAGFWDAAAAATTTTTTAVVTPDTPTATSGRRRPRWTRKMVRDVARTWAACQVFLYIPIYQLNDGGIGAAPSNLAASMTLGGAPNDLLANFNALTIVVATPLVAYGLYPALSRRGVRFGSMRRMAFGMVVAAVSSVCGGLAQLAVYRTSPCGYYASTCAAGPSPVSVWWELPMVVLGAVSEIFVNVTSYEMAYARAPPNMKSCVFAICLLMTALYAAVGECLTPIIRDPYLVWLWMGPAIVLFAQTAVFWIRHRSIDEDAYMTYADDEDETDATAGLPRLQEDEVSGKKVAAASVAEKQEE